MGLYVPDDRDLNERERTILQTVIQLFVLHASPVGSRVLSRHLEKELNLSPSTIRNVMADLEAMGYITHPHTSAGRMPTDKGYRFYVDTLLEFSLQPQVEQHIVDELSSKPRETLLRDASKVLGKLAKALAVVKVPKVSDALITKVELISLSSDKILVIIALDSDLIRTITLESNTVIDPTGLEVLSCFLNEKLAGKTLYSLSGILPYASADTDGPTGSLLRLFVDEVGRLSTTDTESSVHVAGAHQLLENPEFGDPARMRSVIELMENSDVIVHLIDAVPSTSGVAVRIGNELQNEQLADYSLITTMYRVGSATGSISLIGPRRMDYVHMMGLVQTVSGVLHSNLHGKVS